MSKFKTAAVCLVAALSLTATSAAFAQTTQPKKPVAQNSQAASDEKAPTSNSSKAAPSKSAGKAADASSKPASSKQPAAQQTKKKCHVEMRKSKDGHLFETRVCDK